MSELNYENVPVSVRASADGGNVAFGVIINGGFFPFHWMPAGGFADDLATIDADKAQYPSTEPDAAPEP